MATNTQPDWGQFFEQATDAYVDAFEQNVEAQTAFADAFEESIDHSLNEDRTSEAIDRYAHAYEAWMDAAEEMLNRVGDAASGEDVETSEFRDLWLDAANESAKEFMTSSAFAAATGDALDDALDVQAQIDESTQEALRSSGFATTADIDEIGERIVEMERRQQGVEQKLDRLLDAADAE